MTSKWERRQRKQDKARYGMRVSGAGLKTTPTGATVSYSVHVDGVGTYFTSARNREQAVRKLRRMVPRYAKRGVTYRTVEVV